MFIRFALKEVKIVGFGEDGGRESNDILEMKHNSSYLGTVTVEIMINQAELSSGLRFSRWNHRLRMEQYPIMGHI